MLITEDLLLENLIQKSDGAFVYLKERKLLDFNLGSGSFVLGHRNEVLIKALNFGKENGTLFVGGCDLLKKLFESLRNNHPLLDRFILSNTGTEAVLRSIRIARSLTGRDKIILLCGGWHGSHDQTLFNYDFDSKKTVLPLSDGIPVATADNVIFVNPFSERIEEELLKHKDAACILFEPIQGAFPKELPQLFYKAVKKVSLLYGIIPIFDEIISGHRIFFNGYYNNFDNLPSMVIFGKSLGGGLPISSIGISKKLCELFEKEIKVNKLSKVFFGGTFTGNPLSVKSAILTLDYLRENEYLYKNIGYLGRYLREQLNMIFEHFGLPFKIMGFESISKILYNPKDVYINDVIQRDKYQKIDELKSLRGIFINSNLFYGSNNLLFTSNVHTEQVIDEYLDKLKIQLVNAEN